VRLHDLDEGSRPALPISPPACTCGEGPSTTLPPTPNLPLAVKARPPTHLRKSESAHPSVRPVAQVIYWALAGVWVAFFLVWLALVLSPGKRRRGLRLFLFVLPLVMFGNSVVQVELAKP